MEQIVSFISLPSLTTVREVLVEGEDENSCKLKALSTATPWLCSEYFYGNVKLMLRPGGLAGEPPATQGEQA